MIGDNIFILPIIKKIKKLTQTAKRKGTTAPIKSPAIKATVSIAVQIMLIITQLLTGTLTLSVPYANAETNASVDNAEVSANVSRKVKKNISIHNMYVTGNKGQRTERIENENLNDHLNFVAFFVAMSYNINVKKTKKLSVALFVFLTLLIGGIFFAGCGEEEYLLFQVPPSVFMTSANIDGEYRSVIGWSNFSEQSIGQNFRVEVGERYFATADTYICPFHLVEKFDLPSGINYIRVMIEGVRGVSRPSEFLQWNAFKIVELIAPANLRINRIRQNAVGLEWDGIASQAYTPFIKNSEGVLSQLNTSTATNIELTPAFHFLDIATEGSYYLGVMASLGTFSSDVMRFFVRKAATHTINFEVVRLAAPNLTERHGGGIVFDIEHDFDFPVTPAVWFETQFGLTEGAWQSRYNSTFADGFNLGSLSSRFEYEGEHYFRTSIWAGFGYDSFCRDSNTIYFFLESELSNSVYMNIEIYRLNSPSSWFSDLTDGILNWSAVQHATGYSISISADDNSGGFATTGGLMFINLANTLQGWLERNFREINFFDIQVVAGSPSGGFYQGNGLMRVFRSSRSQALRINVNRVQELTEDVFESLGNGEYIFNFVES